MEPGDEDLSDRPLFRGEHRVPVTVRSRRVWFGVPRFGLAVAGGVPQELKSQTTEVTEGKSEGPEEARSGQETWRSLRRGRCGENNKTLDLYQGPLL